MNGTTSVRIDTKLYKELRQIAERRGLLIVQVLRRALSSYINQNKKEPS